MTWMHDHYIANVFLFTLMVGFALHIGTLLEKLMTQQWLQAKSIIHL
jgi:hypothetical protein